MRIGIISGVLATVRVRIRDEKAYLTIKGKSVNGGMTRYEFEKEITMQTSNTVYRFIEILKMEDQQVEQRC